MDFHVGSPHARSPNEACCFQFRNTRRSLPSLSGTQSVLDWFPGIFLVLYQTCKLLSAVPRLHTGKGWQGLTDRLWPGLDSCFSYNFLQAGLRLSGCEKALPA